MDKQGIIKGHRHFKKRLSERFGIHLTEVGLKKILKMIRNGGGSTFVERKSDGRSIHRIHWEDKLVYVVWDPEISQPITCLTPQMFFELCQK